MDLLHFCSLLWLPGSLNYALDPGQRGKKKLELDPASSNEIRVNLGEWLTHN